MEKPLIEVENLHKYFKVGTQTVKVIKGISLRVSRGDFLIIYGPSGCGKSTFLHVVLGLETPTKGAVSVMGHNLYSFDADQRADLRKKYMGIVYQQSTWIKSLNVIENVSFPLILLGAPREKALRVARDQLAITGMLDWAEYSPAELSAGQQQKASLSRALVNNPSLIVTDEPTGNLDSASGRELIRLLETLNQEEGKTVLMVTHNLDFLKYASRVVNMSDGKFFEKQ